MLRNNRKTEGGNVFVIILLGVVLFASLVFTVSRGLNLGSSKMTATQARPYAADIVNYAQMVGRAVDRLYQGGVSEGDISFENPVVSGYEHTPAVADTAKVFHASGGGVTWKTPISRSTAQGNNEWIYDSGYAVENLGDPNKSELMMFLFVPREVCSEINRQLGRSIDLDTPIGPSVAFVKFTGSYRDDITYTFVSDVTAEGCYPAAGTEGTQAGDYIYGKLLLAR